jgi:hypothetical protein
MMKVVAPSSACYGLSQKKEVLVHNTSFLFAKSLCRNPMVNDYRSSETVSFFLPFLRRAAKILRPLWVDILWRKPCLLALFLRDG